MVRYTFLVMSVLLSGCLSFVSGKELTRPTPQQAAWQDDEIGMFIHFGLETWQDKESDDETTIENMKLFSIHPMSIPNNGSMSQNLSGPNISSLSPNTSADFVFGRQIPPNTVLRTHLTRTAKVT